MPQGTCILKTRKELNQIGSRPIQKLFESKLSQQGSVFPQFSSRLAVAKFTTNFSSEMEPEFLEVKNTSMSTATNTLRGRLMSDL